MIRCTSVRLSSADHELALEVLVAYFSRFLLDPSFNANLLDSAEIVDFHVVRKLSSFVGCGREKRAGKIITVTTHVQAPRLDTIQRSTSTRWEMIMLAILLSATFAGDIFFWNSGFRVYQFCKIVCEVFLIEFAIETVEPTWCRQSSLVRHNPHLWPNSTPNSTASQDRKRK